MSGDKTTIGEMLHKMDAEKLVGFLWGRLGMAAAMKKVELPAKITAGEFLLAVQRYAYTGSTEDTKLHANPEIGKFLDFHIGEYVKWMNGEKTADI